MLRLLSPRPPLPPPPPDPTLGPLPEDRSVQFGPARLWCGHTADARRKDQEGNEVCVLCSFVLLPGGTVHV